MARARNIKPSFFKNPELVELGFDRRLLFVGLWCLADREGLLEDRPKHIKMEVFPADNVDVERALQDLHEADLIHRYNVNGRRYIAIPKFLKHQNPHYKEQPSTIPKPEALPPIIEHQTRGNDPDDTGVKPEVHPPRNGGQTGLIPDSGFPPLSPQHQAGNGKRRRQRQPATPAPSTFEVTEELAAWAVSHGLPEDRIDPETMAMLLHHRSKGTLFADWQAAWRNWMLKAIEFSKQRQEAR